MRNRDVAQVLYDIADLLEIEGVGFKPRAYRKAAQTVETLSEDVAEIMERGELEELPGVGPSIAKKITELVETDWRPSLPSPVCGCMMWRTFYGRRG